MLIACPECKGQLSTAAPLCPHCGYPNRQTEAAKPQNNSNAINPSESAAYVGVLKSFALGAKKEFILANASILISALKQAGQNIDPQDLNEELVSKVERHHLFYLTMIQQGWVDNLGRQEKALDYFGRDEAEVTEALGMYKAWREFACPQADLENFMNELLLSMMGGRTAQECEQVINKGNEPRKSIALAEWNSSRWVPARENISRDSSPAHNSAMDAVLGAYAAGPSNQEAFLAGEILRAARSFAERWGLSKEAIDAIDETMVDRVHRWYALYLHALREGWLSSKWPSAEKIANLYFSSNVVEASLAMRLFPQWVEKALPKEMLDSLLIDSARAMAEEGVPADVMLNGLLQSCREPRKSIIRAVWNSPERVALREQAKVSTQPIASTQSERTAGCMSVLMILITGALGIVIGVWVSFAR